MTSFAHTYKGKIIKSSIKFDSDASSRDSDSSHSSREVRRKGKTAIASLHNNKRRRGEGLNNVIDISSKYVDEQCEKEHFIMHKMRVRTYIYSYFYFFRSHNSCWNSRKIFSSSEWIRLSATQLTSCSHCTRSSFLSDTVQNTRLTHTHHRTFRQLHGSLWPRCAMWRLHSKKRLPIIHETSHSRGERSPASSTLWRLSAQWGCVGGLTKPTTLARSVQRCLPTTQR